MANVISAKSLFSMLDAYFTGVTVKAMLVGATYDAIAANTKRDSHNFKSDITDEITGTNYTAGGKALTGLAVTRDDANDIYYVDANNPVWTNLTTAVDIYGMVFYIDTGVAGTSPVLGYVSVGQQVVTGADFEGNIPSTGFYSLEPKAGS